MTPLWLAWIALAPAAEVDLKVVAEDFALSSDIERSIRRVLVRMFHTYERTLGVRFPQTVPVTIRLVQDRTTYDNLVPGTLSHTRTAGFFSSSLGEGVVWRGPSEADTRGTIVHETSHYLLDQASVRLPLWLNEGLAELFETARTDGNAVWLEPQGVMVQWMHKHPSAVPSVEQMIRAERSDWAGWEASPLGSPHGYGWAVCAFLMSTNQGKITLAELIAASQTFQADTMLAAIEDHYRGGVSQLERDYSAWWRGSPGRTQLPIPVDNDQAGGWVTCRDGRLVRVGSGMTCGSWVAGDNGVMRWVEE